MLEIMFVIAWIIAMVLTLISAVRSFKNVIVYSEGVRSDKALVATAAFEWTVALLAFVGIIIWSIKLYTLITGTLQ